jgi:hypothetical protein
MVCCRYVIVNTLHKGGGGCCDGGDDDDNNYYYYYYNKGQFLQFLRLCTD